MTAHSTRRPGSMICMLALERDVLNMNPSLIVCDLRAGAGGVCVRDSTCACSRFRAPRQLPTHVPEAATAAKRGNTQQWAPRYMLILLFAVLVAGSPESRERSGLGETVVLSTVALFELPQQKHHTKEKIEAMADWGMRGMAGCGSIPRIWSKLHACSVEAGHESIGLVDVHPPHLKWKTLPRNRSRSLLLGLRTLAR